MILSLPDTELMVMSVSCSRPDSDAACASSRSSRISAVRPRSAAAEASLRMREMMFSGWRKSNT
jgi:hypothetical protein